MHLRVCFEKVREDQEIFYYYYYYFCLDVRRVHEDPILQMNWPSLPHKIIRT